ncbi:MAG TPA: efflux RND transporter permease subunit [Bryobacteraceae bacterium]|nr:efflux RND transporter permease subunit [Bryobacteraceae bacterium]
MLTAANSNTPKGHFSDEHRTWEVGANDQIFTASDYRPLIVAYQNGSAVRVSDVGEVLDSVKDIRNAGDTNGLPSVLVAVFRQPNANIIHTVDRISGRSSGILHGFYSTSHQADGYHGSNGEPLR